MTAHQGAKLVIVGVDGLDYDVVKTLGASVVPTLSRILANSLPHRSVFPPDSVPSWTTIATGLPPHVHGQMSNVKFFLETEAESAVNSDLNAYSELCFWEHSQGNDIAIINPFLAFPAWAPKGTGAMVAGPPFAEGPPSVSDVRRLLSPGRPPKMGGFTRIPTKSDVLKFSYETLAVGRAQYDYALEQLEHRRWDVFFFTSLVIDRVEHYTWRYFDQTDPTHVASQAADVIPEAHRDLDTFLTAVTRLLAEGDQLIVVSDHGHGQRASMGVNFHELFRRRGLLQFADGTTGLKRRTVEAAKTLVYSAAPRLRCEDAAIALARRVPAKRALKSGTYVGRPTEDAPSVRDLAGSNPFGGIDVPPGLEEEVVRLLHALKFRGRPVVKWLARAEEMLGVGALAFYPPLLFELEPAFGPTWNLYGPIFSPILTRRRQSGGHTQRAVIAGSPTLDFAPADSINVHRLLMQYVSRT